MTKPDHPARWQSAVETGTRRYALAGYLVLAAFAGGFGYWAATVPLSGAAMASAVVIAAGQNVNVQHLEGGIVRSIEVEEGDRVEAGDPMLTLDPTVAEAQLNRFSKQLVTLRAKAARLVAERDGAEDIRLDDLPPVSVEGFDPESVLEDQRKEFQARLARYNTELEILDQRAEALIQALKGLEAQKQAAERQLAVVDEEARRKKELLDQGLTNRSEYTALLRSQAELVGQIGTVQSQIASSSVQAVEAREQIDMIAERVSHIAGWADEVMFVCGHFFDGFKADAHYALECAATAYIHGARWVVLGDSNGGALPHEIAEIVAEVAKALPSSHIGIDCLNDSGNAASTSVS